MAQAGLLRSALVGLGLVVAGHAVVMAAEPLDLEWGTRVRATVTDPVKGKTRTITGTITDVGDTTITVQKERASSPLVISRGNIDELEVSMQSSRKGRGALVGLGVGALLGAAIGFASGDDPPGMISFSAGAKAGMGAIVLGPIGAIIGALAAPGEQWQAVPSDRVQLGFRRGPRGESGFFLVARF